MSVTTDRPGSRDRLWDLAPVVAFAVFVAVAFPLVLFRLGSYHWFFRDDFFFIDSRELTPDDLFRPHNVHWSTVPVVAFRVLWKVVGLRSYVPYQAVVLTLHLSAAVLLRLVMRRAGVAPWVASVAAAAFVLFGPGSENIVWAFQIGFVGSLVFGLLQLVLADHDGPVDRRDLLAVGAGVLSLMSSGVGITMAIVVGMAMLLRRGWKVAALQTVPLAATYSVWFLFQQPDLSSPFGRPTVSVMITWVRSGETATFLGLGHYQVVAGALAVMLVAGLVVVLASHRGQELRNRLALPLALFIGSLVFALITCQGRWAQQGPVGARSSRYVYLGAAMTLPLLALAADALARRWRIMLPVMLALFLVAVPSNSRDFGGFPFGAKYFDSEERILTGAVVVPFARDVPRDVRPIPDVFLSTDLDMGFLLDAYDRGKLNGAPTPLAPATLNELRVRLGVAQRKGVGSKERCVTRGRPLDLDPAKGTVYGLTSQVRIATVERGQVTSPWVVFRPGEGGRLTVELPGLHLRLRPVGPATTFSLCRGS